MYTTRMSLIGAVAMCVNLLVSFNTKGNDLLIMSNGSIGTSPGIFRFSGETGAFAGKFAGFNGRGYSMTYSPDGNLYVGTGSNISRYDGQTGAFLNVFVPGTN